MIEIDGWGHNMGAQPLHDARRDAWLAEQGVCVLRYTADDVFRDPTAIADGVWDTCVERIKAQRPQNAPSVTSPGGAAPPPPQAGQEEESSSSPVKNGGGGARRSSVTEGALKPYFPTTFSTARVIASTPVRIVGSAAGAKNGEWLTGSSRPSALALATSAGSEPPMAK